MALTNKGNATAPQNQTPAPQTKGKGNGTNANQEVLAQGNEILASMTEEQRAVLGSKSGTLHFVHLLGLASKKSSRRIEKGVSEACSFPVGITLVSDEDIQVPVIDVLKDKNTGIDPATDISYRTVKAGEQFDVTYYEFMYLILRDEYAGFLEANNDPNGAYFSAKLPAYVKGEAKLPTPTINLRNGSVKATMIDIDEQTPEGVKIKAPYAEKFGPLLRKARKPQRAAGKKSNTPAPTVMAVALQKILGIKG